MRVQSRRVEQLFFPRTAGGFMTRFGGLKSRVTRLPKGMHQLAAALLALSMSACPESYRVIDEEVRETDAGIRIKDFRRESVLTDGSKQWFVEADEAFIYQKGNQPERIVAYKFRFEQYDAEGNLTDVMTADRGEIDQDDEMFYLSGNVYFKGQDKSRIVRAEEVEYDRIDEILTSEKPITIIEEGLTTRCTRGAEVDYANNRQVCKGPVVISVSDSGSDQSAGDLFQ